MTKPLNWSVTIDLGQAVLMASAPGGMTYFIHEYVPDPEEPGPPHFSLSVGWGSGGPDVHDAEIGQYDTLVEALRTADEVEEMHEGAREAREEAMAEARAEARAERRTEAAERWDW
jgi:hypothetical protein